MRLFLALSVPSDIQQSIRRSLAEAQSLSPFVRWVCPENYHLTLEFLGEVPASELPALTGRLDALSHPALTLRLGQPAARPSPRKPRLLWYDVEGAVVGLRHALELPGAEPFSAHVTLGRLREPRPVPGWPPARVEAEWRVNEVLLMQSHLRPQEPPRYEVLHTVHLD